MRALLQRVSEAAVEVDQKVVGKIGPGLLILLGITHADSQKEVDWLVNKLIHLRIFTDENQKMNKSLIDVKGSLLVVSQFTLYADAKEGKRPSFTGAAKPEHAEILYETFKAQLVEKGMKVESGVFGAKMKVFLVNDGPVTLMLER